MIDRRLLTEALRIDNKDVLPKFGSSELKLIKEGQEQIKLSDIVAADGTITEDGIYSIMDSLERGSVGIVDDENEPLLSFRKVDQEIQAHNLFADETDILDVSSEAIKEYLHDQIDVEYLGEENSEVVIPTNVIFKREPNQYDGEMGILAVFPDEISHEGDESYVQVYNSVSQLGDASEEYVHDLEDATPEEYADLADELREQGYNLNILNGLQEEPSSDIIDPYEGTYHEDSPVELPSGYALDEDNKNYGICIARDIGNDVEIVKIKEGYASYNEALFAIDDIEDELDPDDPTLDVFVVYSDGTCWYDADTGEELEYEPEESVNEDSNSFKSVKDAKIAISSARRELQKELKNGNFGENFGQDKVRELRSRTPMHSDDLEPDELRLIQNLVNKFQDWCMTVAPKHEESDIDPLIDDVYNRIVGTALTAKNILISAYRNNESKGLEDLGRIYANVEESMEQLVEQIRQQVNNDSANEE